MDAHIAIFHSAYDPANSRSQRLQRNLCKLPDVRLLATPYPLCAPAHREKRRGGGEEENQKNERIEERREERTEAVDRRRTLSVVLEFVRGLSADKYDVSHLLN